MYANKNAIFRTFFIYCLAISFWQLAIGYRGHDARVRLAVGTALTSPQSPFLGGITALIHRAVGFFDN
jgi:hypothetical protein